MCGSHVREAYDGPEKGIETQFSVLRRPSLGPGERRTLQAASGPGDWRLPPGLLSVWREDGVFLVHCPAMASQRGRVSGSDLPHHRPPISTSASLQLQELLTRAVVPLLLVSWL